MWELDQLSTEDAFELWCCRRLLRVPWTAREKLVTPKGNQFWITLGRTDTKASILWPPDAKSQLTEKILMLGKLEGKRRRGKYKMRWLGINSITDSMDMTLRHNWFLDWTTITLLVIIFTSIFSCSVGYLFIFSMVSFAIQQL